MGPGQLPASSARIGPGCRRKTGQVLRSITEWENMSLLRRGPRTVAVVAALAAGAGGVLFALPNDATASPAATAHHTSHNPLGVTRVNLVSDVPGNAPDVDPALVNAWGLALSPTSPLWSANTGSSTSTLYTLAPGSSGAATVPTVRVTIPGPAPHAPGLPTGQVFNGGNGFVEHKGDASAPGRFILSTITGTIVSWSPGLDPNIGAAQIEATVPGATYTGLALATSRTGGDRLYAANAAQGRIDVFDSSFHQVTLPPWAFQDAFLPTKFAPFNAQTIDGNVFVAYMEPDPTTHKEVKGRGLGAVDEFTPDGRLVARIATGQSLNAPWGMAVAPASWGPLAGSLLVGNFGDGRINVLPRLPFGHDRFLPVITGQLKDGTGQPVTIDGLWALLPGTPATGGTDSIFFSAGTDDEQHGLIGVLRKP
jgi:uncharacterized protein (TIGR03118 family)